MGSTISVGQPRRLVQPAERLMSTEARWGSGDQRRLDPGAQEGCDEGRAPTFLSVWPKTPEPLKGAPAGTSAQVLAKIGFPLARQRLQPAFRPRFLYHIPSLNRKFGFLEIEM